MPVRRRVIPSIKFTGTHLYTWVERGTVRIKPLALEYNTVPPTRTRTARSGYERTNTRPPRFHSFGSALVTTDNVNILMLCHCFTSLYIELTISFLTGRTRTMNFRNQRLWRHIAACRLCNNNVKDTQDHGTGNHFHVCPQCMISNGNVTSN